MKQRLYLQIYVAFLAVSLLWVIATAATVRALWDADPLPRHLYQAASTLARELPPSSAPVDDQRHHLDALADELDLRMGLWSADGDPIASTGALPAPSRNAGSYVFHAPGGPGVVIELDDGRWLVAADINDHVRRERFLKLLLALGTMLGVIAIGCYPVARRITRRLEALQDGVEGLGRGDLARRVPVQGTDEVAELARRFNESAARIEALLDGQRRMLASASHELRSPLARLRLAMEMLDDGSPERHALAEGAARDVADLDALIGDLLLASRLEARVRADEPVDVRALVDDELARIGAPPATGAATMVGDAKALRGLVRNLIENALKHGGGLPEVTIEDGDPVRIVVADRGPGVPDSEREPIFEPFYRPAGHAEGRDGGVGLGLALVRQIALHHGGKAWVEPRDGGGSRFVVELSPHPAATASPA